MGEWLLYGANGYTGRLIAEAAVARGLRPVLAGRNAAAITTLASDLGCSSLTFSLDDTAALDRAIGDLGTVLLARSKELIPRTTLGKDAVLVQRDQRPKVRGVNRSARLTLEGRLPANVRWGTSHSGVPSRRTSSAVLPNVSARRTSWKSLRPGRRTAGG